MMKYFENYNWKEFKTGIITLLIVGLGINVALKSGIIYLFILIGIYATTALILTPIVSNYLKYYWR